MSDRISNDEFVAVMNEAFSRGQQIRFTPTGRSMLPMLDGVNDTVTFSPKPDHLKKYDVAFYRRDNGQLVLHRVVGFDDGGYVFCGDSQYSDEYGITDDHILALMVQFTHKGKSYQTSDVSYRWYIFRLMTKKRLRKAASAVYHKLFKRK